MAEKLVYEAFMGKPRPVLTVRENEAIEQYAAAILRSQVLREQKDIAALHAIMTECFREIN